jgi:hypothetical protein
MPNVKLSVGHVREDVVLQRRGDRRCAALSRSVQRLKGAGSTAGLERIGLRRRKRGVKRQAAVFAEFMFWNKASNENRHPTRIRPETIGSLRIDDCPAPRATRPRKKQKIPKCGNETQEDRQADPVVLCDAEKNVENYEHAPSKN